MTKLWNIHIGNALNIAGWLFQSLYFATAAVVSHIVAAWPKLKLRSTSTPALAANAAERQIYRKFKYRGQ